MRELNVKQIKQVNGGVDWSKKSSLGQYATLPITEKPIIIPIVPTPTWPTM